MANKARKTEHAGAKHGGGAYWGRKAQAKAESNRARRTGDRNAAKEDRSTHDGVAVQHYMNNGELSEPYPPELIETREDQL